MASNHLVRGMMRAMEVGTPAIKCWYAIGSAVQQSGVVHASSRVAIIIVSLATHLRRAIRLNEI